MLNLTNNIDYAGFEKRRLKKTPQNKVERGEIAEYWW